MHPHQPDVVHNLRSELKFGRHWVDRAIVLVYAIVAGLFVVAFTALVQWTDETFEALRAASPWAPLLWTPLLTAGIVWCTRRFAPGAAGSGIPQVMAALDPGLPAADRGLFVSVRLSLSKIVLTSTGLLAGLSLGREGPSVQVAAGVMHHARRWLSPGSGIRPQDLLTAGGAAGIAAAFNTPLAGVVFAIEELSRDRESRNMALVVVAIVLAGLMAVSIFGNNTYFGRLQVQSLSWNLLGPGLLVVAASGLAGGLFSRLMAVSVRGLPDRVSAFRQRRPVAFGAICGLAVAVIGLVTGGVVSGAGYHATIHVLEGDSKAAPVFTLLKFIATWLSAWSGVPGGIFAPSLSIGASIGRDVAELLGMPGAIPLIALGMVGFLAAVTQAPLTSFIIVMEMVDGHGMVLSLMATALLASGISRLIAHPLYPTLTQLMLAAVLPPAPVPAPAAPPSDPSTARPPEAEKAGP